MKLEASHFVEGKQITYNRRDLKITLKCVKITLFSGV